MGYVIIEFVVPFFPFLGNTNLPTIGTHILILLQKVDIVLEHA